MNKKNKIFLFEEYILNSTSNIPDNINVESAIIKQEFFDCPTPPRETEQISESYFDFEEMNKDHINGITFSTLPSMPEDNGRSIVAEKLENLLNIPHTRTSALHSSDLNLKRKDLNEIPISPVKMPKIETQLDVHIDLSKIDPSKLPNTSTVVRNTAEVGNKFEKIKLNRISEEQYLIINNQNKNQEIANTSLNKNLPILKTGDTSLTHISAISKAVVENVVDVTMQTGTFDPFMDLRNVPVDIVNQPLLCSKNNDYTIEQLNLFEKQVTVENVSTLIVTDTKDLKEELTISETEITMSKQEQTCIENDQLISVDYQPTEMKVEPVDEKLNLVENTVNLSKTISELDLVNSTVRQPTPATLMVASDEFLLGKNTSTGLPTDSAQIPDEQTGANFIESDNDAAKHDDLDQVIPMDLVSDQESEPVPDYSFINPEKNTEINTEVLKENIDRSSEISETISDISKTDLTVMPKQEGSLSLKKDKENICNVCNFDCTTIDLMNIVYDRHVREFKAYIKEHAEDPEKINAMNFTKLNILIFCDFCGVLLKEDEVTSHMKDEIHIQKRKDAICIVEFRRKRASFLQKNQAVYLINKSIDCEYLAWQDSQILKDRLPVEDYENGVFYGINSAFHELRCLLQSPLFDLPSIVRTKCTVSSCGICNKTFNGDYQFGIEHYKSCLHMDNVNNLLSHLEIDKYILTNESGYMRTSFDVTFNRTKKQTYNRNDACEYFIRRCAPSYRFAMKQELAKNEIVIFCDICAILINGMEVRDHINTAIHAANAKRLTTCKNFMRQRKFLLKNYDVSLINFNFPLQGTVTSMSVYEIRLALKRELLKYTMYGVLFMMHTKFSKLLSLYISDEFLQLPEHVQRRHFFTTCGICRFAFGNTYGNGIEHLQSPWHQNSLEEFMNPELVPINSPCIYCGQFLVGHALTIHMMQHVKRIHAELKVGRIKNWCSICKVQIPNSDIIVKDHIASIQHAKQLISIMKIYDVQY